MIGMALGAMAKGVGKSLGKKTDKKVDAKKFAGKAEKTKADAGKSQPGGALVPSPGGEIIKKVVDVKIEKPGEPKGDPSNPVGSVLIKINEHVYAIERSVQKEQKAHKKKFKKDRVKQQKQKRLAKESWLEGAAKSAGAAAGKIASKTGITSLWDTILQLIAVSFLGWLTRYLPQILGFAKFVIEWVGKIGRFVAMLVTPIIKGVIWIAGAGAKLVNMLLGTDPEEAAQKNLLGNLADIQKKVPLMEAAFAAFMILGAKGKIKKHRKPGAPKPKKTKLTKGQRRQAARKRLQKMKAKRNLKKVKKFGAKQLRKTKIAGARKMGPAARNMAKGVGSKIGKAAGKVGKLAGKLTKGLKMLGKFAKIPIVGPLIIAVTQILAGEPIGKALFMGLGAALGGGLGTVLAGALAATGIGAVLSPIAMLLGEGIGMFVGELLYEAMLGQGPGAAMKRLGEVVGGIFKGIGNVGKAIMKFLFGGGIWKFLGNVLGGMGKVIGWLFSPKGLLGLIGKLGMGALRVLKFLLFDMIPMVLAKVGGASKAVMEWIGAGVGRFVKDFPMVKFPEEGVGEIAAKWIERVPGGKRILGLGVPFTDWNVRSALEKLPSIPEALGWIFNKIPGMGGLVKDGKVEGMPKIWQLFNPVFMGKHTFKSFFPPKGAAPSLLDQSSPRAEGSIDSADMKADDLMKPKGAEEKSSTASSISSSASYDKKGGGGGGIVPVPVKQMRGGITSSSDEILEPDSLNKYELVSTYSKAMMLAKLYKD